MVLTIEAVINVFEYALVLAGAGWLAWLGFHRSGRAWRARPPALPRWEVGFVDFLTLIWLTAAAGLIALFLLRVAIGRLLARQPDADTLELVTYGCVFHVGAVVTWFLARAHARRRVHAPAALPSGRTARPWARAGALTLLVAMPLVTATDLAWEPLLKWVGLPVERQDLVDRFLDVRSPVALGIMIVVALVIAPIGEEIAFRGALYRFLSARTPRWVALAASAGLFALIHGYWSSFLPLFVLGIVFALAYERTGSIAVPILAHALFNLNSLLLVLGGGGR